MGREKLRKGYEEKLRGCMGEVEEGCVGMGKGDEENGRRDVKGGVGRERGDEEKGRGNVESFRLKGTVIHTNIYT